MSDVQPCPSLRFSHLRFQGLGLGKELSRSYLMVACIPQGTTYSFKIRPDSRLTFPES